MTGVHLLAVDPGPEQSAFVAYRDGSLVEFGKVDNAELLARLWRPRDPGPEHHLAIEMIACYGMSVGKSVFDTCVWIGRYIEAWGAAYTLIPRHDVKMHLCHTKNSSDSNVREALIDRWGGKTKALGTKADRKLKQPATAGPLSGVAGDVWAALAVAVTWSDAHGNGADLRALP